MSAEKSRFVVSADWLEKNLGAPGFRIVDASFYLPAQQRNAAEEYAAAHIPGAVLFDHDAIADHSTGLPHMVPAPEVFAEAVGRMGISETDTIVIYDGIGMFASPRAWWLFRAMGAENVYVLDGGFDGWKREGRPVTSDLPEPAPATFRPSFDPSRVTSLEAMRSIVDQGSVQIADARSAGRFAGTDPEPRAGLRSGHMPGAKSVPSTHLVEGGYLKPLPELRKALEAAGIDLARPVVTSCGSGITAAIISLSLASLGHDENSLYDGSWTEWGGLSDTPVVTAGLSGSTTATRKAGALKAHITRLEMTAPPRQSLPLPVNITTAVMRVPEIPTAYYRFLYHQVGRRWHWVDRLRMDDDALRAILDDKRTEIAVLYVNGAPAGFYEFFRQDDDIVEFCHFGLMEHTLGLGVGKWFLLQALYAAWAHEPRKVVVTTNDLDHPRALQLYQMFGFSPVSTSDALVRPLGDDELLKVFRGQPPS